MNIAFFLGHPAQFHLLKNCADILQKKGHNIYFLVKKKDILIDLLNNYGYKYTLIRSDRTSSFLGLAKSVFTMEYNTHRFLHKNEIDLLVGTTLTFAAKLTKHVKTLILVEDDISIIKSYSRIAYPWADQIIVPQTCNNGKYEYKTTHYSGFHKLAYLHPNRFTPDINVVKKYISTDRPYFLMRFAKLNAYHDLDANAHGFTTKTAQTVIDILSKVGDIYITSEKPLESQLEKYRLHINPLDIHHIMAFATIYIGDSQSMAVEAAMLGTPSIRFNDFAGKIGVLEELEHKYKLTFGIPSSNPQLLYDMVNKLLTKPNLREVFQERKNRMLNDKIDVTTFLAWFLENYPTSKQIMHDNPEYQMQFK